MYACPCLSALGVAARAHTHLVCYTLYHATTVLHIMPCNNAMKKHIVQRHNVGIVPMEKTGTIHGTLCPSAPPEGTDLPKLPVRRTGGSRKIAPRKPVAKKGSEGALI